MKKLIIAIIIAFMAGIVFGQTVLKQRYILSEGTDTVDKAQLQRHLDDIAKRLQQGGL